MYDFDVLFDDVDASGYSTDVLISLGGLPGVGKTTIARAFARQVGALHLEVDSIEQAIRDSQAGIADSYGPAYRVAYAVARDNLKLGRTVITDCVNPLRLTRDAWLDVAKTAGVPVVEVEITCSDAVEHRRRIQTQTVITNASGPKRWEEVMRHYQTWDRQHILIDTADQNVDQSVALLRRAVIA